MGHWRTRIVEALRNTRGKRHHLRRLAENPDDPLAMLRAAEVFAGLQERERAVLLYRRAAERFWSAGQLGRARAALRLAERLAPEDRNVKQQLSRLTAVDEGLPEHLIGYLVPRDQSREQR